MDILVDMDLTEAVALLDASPDHRILRRISMDAGRLLNVEPLDRDMHFGLFVDTETTGLDHAKDAVVEFGDGLH